MLNLVLTLVLLGEAVAFSAGTSLSTLVKFVSFTLFEKKWSVNHTRAVWLNICIENCSCDFNATSSVFYFTSLRLLNCTKLLLYPKDNTCCQFSVVKLARFFVVLAVTDPACFLLPCMFFYCWKCVCWRPLSGLWQWLYQLDRTRIIGNILLVVLCCFKIRYYDANYHTMKLRNTSCIIL